MAAVREINAELREGWDVEGEGEGEGEGGDWVVGGERGLECQLGYLKFGRGPEAAEAVGKAAEEERHGHKGAREGVEMGG